ncbi:hypothetical protein WN55_04674 [Dufourea novaeangliae]|uniref:Uncharacterized protein n=1 Tax=Dufourea novaeangliae TaxID=178035 RepID=A0A154P309_DUFNO|nr:hypothetical protein WN55_04674 [Dufourea novaeangliae]
MHARNDLGKWDISGRCNDSFAAVNVRGKRVVLAPTYQLNHRHSITVLNTSESKLQQETVKYSLS